MRKTPLNCLSLALVAAASLAAASQDASAATVTAHVFSNPGNIVAPTSNQLGSLAGNALFSLNTNTSTLTITLTNTQSIATQNGSELIGIFWDVTGGSFSGTFSNATLGATSVVVPAGGDVGSFAYTTTGGSSSQVIGDTGLSPYGVSAAGLGINYTNMRYLGGASAPNSALDGLDGGLIGTAGGLNIPSNKPVIQNQIVYTFTNVSGLAFDSTSITNLADVQFFYGTTLAQPPVVPLPAAAWSGTAVLSALALVRKLRKHRHAA